MDFQFVGREIQQMKQPLFCKSRSAGTGYVASMFREERSASQSSLISLSAAETSRSNEASLGKSVATRVRRLISLLSRSQACVGANMSVANPFGHHEEIRSFRRLTCTVSTNLLRTSGRFFSGFFEKNFCWRGRWFPEKCGSLRAAAGEKANTASDPLRGTVSDGSRESCGRGGR